jgi:two-component system, chemotaxis family, response regulator Rcp1
MEELNVERLILVLEANLDHAHLIKDAFQKSSVPHQVVAIADGVQAMDFLHRRGKYAEAHRPDLILLDLNLPEKDGKEILAEIKSTPHLRRIPIVVLTLSADEDDILRTYALQGNCYVIKSSDLDHLWQIIQRIEEFWLGIVTLPVE